MANLIGNTINERYQVESELGRGGMGTVYRAHDSTLNRDVALKLMSNTDLGTQGHVFSTKLKPLLNLIIPTL